MQARSELRRGRRGTRGAKGPLLVGERIANGSRRAARTTRRHEEHERELRAINGGVFAIRADALEKVAIGARILAGSLKRGIHLAGSI